MTDWKQHDGGPQPVADDVWVEVADPIEGTYLRTAIGADWGHALQYRILDQDLAHAARLEGIRLGLEAAAREAEAGRRPSMDWCDHIAKDIRALDPETIAKEADRD